MLAVFSWVVFVLFSLTGGQQELSGGDYNSDESSEQGRSDQAVQKREWTKET